VKLVSSPSTGVGSSPRTDLAQAITSFARGFSLEATRPSADEVAALAGIAPAGTRVYVSAVPTRPAQESIEAAVRLRAAGLEPVPHLAVRNFATVGLIDDFLARMTGEAGVERFLVIAGDRDPPAGDFRAAIDVIDGALLRRRGIAEIGLAGYPDGHPRITQQDLDLALMAKINAVEMIGLSVHIVTQFCFRPTATIAWLAKLRDFGVEHPVRIGLAGPTSLTALMRYASRCGVLASAQNLARHAGLARGLFARWTPDGLVSALVAAQSNRRLGELQPHFFSFGGLLQTARWADAVAHGRLALEAGLGFRVAPGG
jgi:methylenetetrahydrofolate reductase (NADPH)